MKFDILVTRHKSLRDVLLERGVEVSEIKSHISSEDEIQDKSVVGILPLHLAARAKEVCVPTLSLSPEDRGRELTYEELKKKLVDLRVYKVKEVRKL